MVRERYETANGLLQAAREMGIAQASFDQLPGWRASEVLDRVIDRFTTRGRYNRYREWIWNDLRDPHTGLQNDENLLLEFGPADTPVWLVTEDWSRNKRGAPFWLFESTLGAVAKTLDNHHLLEFFVVERSFEWLIGQNHHDIWFAVGDHSVAVLQRLSGRDFATTT